MKITLAFLSSAILFSFFARSLSLADSLENLTKSPVLKQMEKRSKSDRIKLFRYSKDLPKNKDYSRLFVEPGGAQLINFWLGVNNPKFRLDSEKRCSKLDRAARCFLEYFGSNNRSEL